MAEITLPIKVHIENLQSVLQDMKGQLGTLKVDSSAYKKLSSIISDIEKRIQNLSVSASKPFINEKQFVDIEKNLVRIEDDFSKLSLSAQSIKFGDLSLNTSQMAELSAFNSQIQSLETSLNAVKNSAKEAFLSTDIGTMWKDLHPEAVTQTFAAITRAITQEVKKQKDALDQAQAQVANYQNTIASSQNLNRFMRQHHVLSAETMGQKLYDSIFNKEGNFKAGGRNLLTQWLETQFQLDPQVVSSLLKGSGKEIQAAFAQAKGDIETLLLGEKTRINTAAREARASTNDGASLAAAEQQKSAAYQQALAVQQALLQSNEAVGKSELDLSTRLEQARGALEQWKAAQVSAAQGNTVLASSVKSANSSLNQLHANVQRGQAQLMSLDTATSKLQGISNFVSRYVGAYAIIRKVSQAIRNALNNIKELDKAITSIAVVTNMSQTDLWNKIGQYTSMAQQYGVMTKDVYTVSQIFYQQGLQTSQVMSLTTETLKMAKIAGIDYSTAANAMTVAIRAFNIEMSNAQSVTDTYSALAAKFAVSSAEIASAMEKTASSAASVGMSLESTSAFISVMEQTTRESAQNIGSALKSIISRYGEMKASPEKLLDVEGEEVAFNKVDTALSSIGISIKDASGQFRDFDDVIMELAAKWNTLDNNTQRYIATIMAGNRQQSRFIALVSNYDELNRAMDTANNSENASIVQVGKTMDSLESKANQVKNAFSQLYLDLHIEDGLKGAYDWLTRILQTVGKLGTAFGALPTLMNLIGFGTGIKGTISNISAMVQAKKMNVKADVSSAEQEIDRLKIKVQEPQLMPVKVHVDDTELQQALNTMMTIATTGLRAGVASANPAMTDAQFAGILATAQKDSSLMTAAGRESVLSQLGIQKNIQQNGEEVANPEYAKMNEFLTQIGAASQALTELSQSAKGATQTDQEKALAGQEAAEADRIEAQESRVSTQAKNEENQASTLAAEGDRQEAHASTIAATTDQQEAQTNTIVQSAAVQKAQADYDAALAARNAAQAAVNAAHMAQTSGTQMNGTALAAAKENLWLAEAARRAAQAVLEKAQADQEGAQSERDNALANREDAQSERENAAANRQNASSKFSWAGHETAMRVTGLFSGLARIAGTAITALGAANEDKSTDNVEMSKILTGIGNGVSMAGTGASMGMMFGPWGAAIGAIGGFLVGGLGAIIDGATMTLEEQLALEKAEAKKATDESMKAQAKTLDLSGQIDNIKKLREAMYDSTDDMQAYKDAMNTMASQYPALVATYDEAGNAIIDLNASEQLLAETRLQASTAAKTAARAEAQTRKTSIDILEKAQQQIPINNTVNEHWIADVGEAYKGYRFRDASNIMHDYDFSTNDMMYWNEAFSEAMETANAFYTKTGSELLDYINNTYLPDRENLYNDEIESFISQALMLDESSQTYAFDPSKEINYDNSVSDINSKLASIHESLGFEAATGVDSKKDYIYGFMGWSNDIILTAERLREFEQRLAERTGNYKDIVNTLDQQIPLLDAQEAVDASLLTVDAEKSAKISSSKIASKLIANQLEAAANDRGLTAGEWGRSTDRAEFDAYEEEKNRATRVVVGWFTGMSDEVLDKTLTAFNSMSEYLSVDDMLTALGYKDAQDFIKNSGIENEEDAEAVLDNWRQSFIDSNKANRDRIFKTIYSEDPNSPGSYIFNTDLRGLQQLSQGELSSRLIERKFHSEIGPDGQITQAPQIISKYADYFTDQLVSINHLAQDGYTEIANNRLSILTAFANSLSQMTSDQQNDMFGIITKVDFSDQKSIQTAITNMEAYAKENNIADIRADQVLGPLYIALEQAANSLLFNVNTLAAQVTESITSASAKMDSIISTNKSGLSFDKALEAFAELQAQFSELTNFNEIFSYDATLGKYVYTQQGLTKAIEAQQGTLQKDQEALQRTADIYTKEITDNSSGTRRARKTFTQLDTIKNAFQDADTLWSAMEQTDMIDVNMSSDVRQAYQSLSKSYIDATDVTQRSAHGFLNFVLEQADAAEKGAADAQVLLNEFNNNIKNQYYQAIDWSKLKLGTDFTKTNQALMENLAESLGFVRQKNNKGETIGWAKNNRFLKELSPDTVLEEYLNQTYDTEDARNIAKTAIEGQIAETKSQSYGTAISELLKGGGTAISEGTAAILAEQGTLNSLVDSSGLLNATQDFVQSTLDLFNSTKDSFTSVAERNKAYGEIITQSFSKANAGKSLLANGNKLDLSTLESSFSALGINWDEIYDAATNSWKSGFEDIFSTDIFGETTIKNWTGFVEQLKLRDIDLSKVTNQEYNKWYRAYLDSQVEDLNDTDEKAAQDAFSKFTEAKVGESVNIQAMRAAGIDVSSLDPDQNGITQVLTEYARDQWIMSINTATISNEALKQTIIEAQNKLKTKYNKFLGLKGIVGKTVSRDAAKTFAQAYGAGETEGQINFFMRANGFIYNAMTEEWEATGDTIKALNARIHDLLHINDGLDHTQEINELQAAVNKVEYEIGQGQQNDAILEILNDYTNVSQEAAAAFKTAFAYKISEDGQLEKVDWDKYFKANDQGGFEVDAAGIIQYLNDIGYKFNDAAQAQIKAIADSYLSNISTAQEYAVSGASSLADMEAFKQSYEEMTGTALSPDAFGYDTVLNAFTLDPTYMQNYINAQKQKLLALGYTEEFVEAYIKDQTETIIQDSIDIESFLNTSTSRERNNEANKLITAISSLSNYLDIANFALARTYSDEFLESLSLDEIRELRDITILQVLESGGQNAVELLKKIKPDATSEELEAVYNNQINKLRTAQEDLGKGVGETIGAMAAKIGFTTGALETVKLDDGTSVITAVHDMTKAYIAIYAAMEETAGHTTADLNSAYVDILTARSQNNVTARETLENAYSMSYQAFGELMDQYGLNMKDVLQDVQTYGRIIDDGFGNLRIEDFNRFAKGMNWDTNSPQFAEAYNSYIDAKVELQNKPAEMVQNAADQLKSIAEAKPGEAVNISYLQKQLGLDSTAFNALFSRYGAAVNDGFLQLGRNVDIPGLISAIGQQAAEAGQLLPEQLAELQDTVEGLLSDITDLISNGIEGKLSNVDAQKLQNWADQYGENLNLQFIHTADGLKLTLQSAKDLYFTMQKVDSLQAEIVFSELKDSLIETRDEFKTVQDTAAYIKDLRSQIENPTNAERLESLQQELELAEKINAVRSIDEEDDSFKFMENKIPAGQNNPLNYWKNWGKAFEAMKAAGKGDTKHKNTMGYEDFYNMVSEMGRLVDLTGGSIKLGENILQNSQDAADLITAAAGALKNVDGELVIDLSKINVDFSSGLKELGQDIDGEVDALADSQINMLDAVIAVLEIIVAMEDLKDLDVNADLTLDFSELGIKVDPNTREITEVNNNLKTTVDKLLALDKTLEDGTSVLEALKIDTGIASFTMKDFLKNWNNTSWLKQNGVTGDVFSTLWSNMLKMSVSDAYNDQSGNVQSIFDLWMQQNWGDLSFQVDTSKYTLKLTNNGVMQVDWEHANYDALKNQFTEYANKTDEEIRQLIQEAEARYKGQEIPIELNTKIKILNNTVIEKKNKDGEGTGRFIVAGHQGQEYSSAGEAAAVANLHEIGAENIHDLENEIASYTDSTGVHEFAVKAGTVKIGSVEIDVESNGQGVVYKYGNYTGNSSEDILDKMIKDDPEYKDLAGLKDETGKINRDSAVYKEYAVKMGFSLTPIITYTINKKKVSGDLSTNTDLRDAVNNFLTDQENWNDQINYSKDGKSVQLTLENGITYTIPKAALEFDDNGKLIDQSLVTYLNQALGKDLSLQDTISAGIKTALESLTEIEPGSLPSLAEAISKLADALTKLTGLNLSDIVTQLQSLTTGDTGEEENLPSIDSINATTKTLIITKADKVTANSDALPTEEANLPKIPSVNVTVKTGKITKIDTLDASGATLQNTDVDVGTDKSVNITTALSAVIKQLKGKLGEGYNLDLSGLPSTIEVKDENGNPCEIPVSDAITALISTVEAHIAPGTQVNVPNITLTQNGKQVEIPVENAVTALLSVLEIQLGANPTLSNTTITLPDGTKVTVSTAVTALLSMLTPEANLLDSDTYLGMVSIGDGKEVTVSDLVTAIITSLIPSVTGATWASGEGEETGGTITLGEDQALSAASVLVLVSALMLGWAEGANTVPDPSGLNLPSEITAGSPIIYNQPVVVKFTPTVGEQEVLDYLNSFGQNTDLNVAKQQVIDLYKNTPNGQQVETWLDTLFGDFGSSSYEHNLQGFWNYINNLGENDLLPRLQTPSQEQLPNNKNDQSSRFNPENLIAFTPQEGSLGMRQQGKEETEELAGGITEGQPVVQAAGETVGETAISSVTEVMSSNLSSLSETSTKAVDTIVQSYTDFENKTISVLGSVKSHWDALVVNIAAAVAVVQAMIQSMQEKISITWEIKLGDKNLGAKGSGADTGYGTGVNEVDSEVQKWIDAYQDAKKKGLESLNIPVEKIDLDASGAEVNEDITPPEAAQATIDKIAALIGTLDPLDLTMIHNLGQQELPSDAKMTITSAVTAVVGKLNIQLDSNAKAVIDGKDKDGLPLPALLKLDEDALNKVKDIIASLATGENAPKVDVDTVDAISKVNELKTKIDEVKQTDVPIIQVLVEDAIKKILFLIALIESIPKKKEISITANVKKPDLGPDDGNPPGGETPDGENPKGGPTGGQPGNKWTGGAQINPMSAAQWVANQWYGGFAKNNPWISDSPTSQSAGSSAAAWAAEAAKHLNPEALSQVGEALQDVGKSGEAAAQGLESTGDASSTGKDGEKKSKSSSSYKQKLKNALQRSLRERRGNASEGEDNEEENEDEGAQTDNTEGRKKLRLKPGRRRKKKSQSPKETPSEETPTENEGEEVPVEAKATSFDPGAVKGADLPVNAAAESFDPGAAKGADVPVNAAAEGFEPPASPPSMPVQTEISGDVPTGDQEATVIYNLEKVGEEPAGGSENEVIYNLIKRGSEPAGGGTYDVYYNIHVRGGVPSGASGTFGLATGNLMQAMGVAKASGTATLMGELGPELVVSNGRYFVAGQNGPEMVSLADDAIVFNHLQTKSLLTKGMSPDRGRAVTNEHNAVAFAHGNVNGGPAMASASAALNALKQLRAMWESLKSAKVSDLAGAGGGGGGGGGGKDDKTTTPEEWVALVERWYNLTQEIAKLEKEITHEEALRSKLQSDFSKNGKQYFHSQKESLDALKAQIDAQEELNISRQKYFDQRREALKDTPLGQIYTFDEEGQMKFLENLDPNKFNGFTNAMEFLTDLYGYDAEGKARYSNEQKYEIMVKAGLEEYMKYDSNGKEIKRSDYEDADEYYKAITEQVKNRIDDYASATQSLWDEIQKGKDEVLKLQEQQNELLQEMRDNQIDLEEQVLDAIIDMREREIEALETERDKLEESTSKYIEGLSDALSKEQEMYENQQDDTELFQKRRRLSILQRSGGSAADIANLQNEIDEAERDRYFDLQQQQIDAIQEASDLELERMDRQIDLMNEQLEYQKEFGLLWTEVYEVMNSSADQITSFITNGNSEFWNGSPLSTAQKVDDVLFSASQWQEYRDQIDILAYQSQQQLEEEAYKLFDAKMRKEYGNDYDTTGQYQQVYRTAFRESGDITEAATIAQQAAQKTYTDDRLREQAAKYGVPYEKGDGNPIYVYKDLNAHYVHSYAQSGSVYHYSGTTTEAHTWDGNRCSRCGGEKPQGSGGGYSCDNCSQLCKGQLDSSGSSSKSTGAVWIGQGQGCMGCEGWCSGGCTSTCGGMTQPRGKGSPKRKASGGYVSHGIYELGEQGTETVLTARQTQVLRNNILSNKPSSLISLLKTYNEGFSMNQRYGLLKSVGERISSTTNNTSEGITIENATVNMNVQQIANDYDAKRAGEQALAEMMRIASKTRANNSVRR